MRRATRRHWYQCQQSAWRLRQGAAARRRDVSAAWLRPRVTRSCRIHDTPQHVSHAQARSRIAQSLRNVYSQIH